MTDQHWEPYNERVDLEEIIDEIAQAAKDALYAPRNLKKGGWLQEEYDYFFKRLKGESDEFRVSVLYDNPPDAANASLVGKPVPEAGDVVNFMAMAIHKKRREEAKT